MGIKERILDVLKWGLILVIAGAVFYVVYPKYQMAEDEIIRYNKMTGEVHSYVAGRWEHLK